MAPWRWLGLCGRRRARASEPELGNLRELLLAPLIQEAGAESAIARPGKPGAPTPAARQNALGREGRSDRAFGPSSHAVVLGASASPSSGRLETTRQMATGPAPNWAFGARVRRC